MSPLLPPICRDCRRLLVHTESVVQRFSRYHKYTVRTDLRQQAMSVMRGVHLAVYGQAHQASQVGTLVWQIDSYKLTLQLAMDIGAFLHGKAGQQKPAASPGFAAFAEPVMTSGIPVPVSLAACHAAWQRAQRGKKASVSQLAFEARWLDRLQCLTATLRVGQWQPVRTVSFVVTHLKTREIHAPEFADRLVHHVPVARLEKLYEPVFIHDAYANRAGRGSPAAVQRLQT